MKRINKMILSVCGLMTSFAAFGQELNLPLIQTKYTSDPAPIVYNDTIYLYTTHDEDGTTKFTMKEWLLYTSTDMVNWQDHGAVASLADFKWARQDNGAWANQVVERNGKWYMYCPILGQGIGVLVADSPYGPFTDPIGKALVKVKDTWHDIDPSVFVDDDGQAYLYCGNEITYAVKLNEDMISTSGELITLPDLPDYTEGPWFYKRNGHYYLVYASQCCPGGIGYAMSDKPLGPWEYKGDVVPHSSRSRANHPAVIDYKGKSYCFSMNWDLYQFKTSRHAEQRSVVAAEMKYNTDGTIQKLPVFQDATRKQIEPFNPFRKVEAETMAWGFGLKTYPKNEYGTACNQIVGDIDDTEYLMLKGVDFKQGASSFTVSALCQLYGGNIELRLDSVAGRCIGTVGITNTKGEYKTFSTKIQNVSGVHDFYFVFKASRPIQTHNLFLMDWWKFSQ